MCLLRNVFHDDSFLPKKLADFSGRSSCIIEVPSNSPMGVIPAQKDEMKIMHIEGRFVSIGNHRMENLEKMYKWSKMIDVIDLECGNTDDIINNVDAYRDKIMNSLIRNNAEARTTFCHFGIYNDRNKIVGYADLQDIDYENGQAELSLSVPEIQKRNRGYGFEAFFLMLKYAFEEIALENILIRTRATNHPVQQMAEKLHCDFTEKVEVLHGREYSLVEYHLKISDFLKLKERFSNRA